MLKVLYVDENNEFRENFTEQLEKSGYSVDSVVGPIKGLELLSNNIYQIVISELEFESISGLRFLESVHNINSDAKRVVLTEDDDPKYEIEALQSKINLYLLKSRGIELAINSITLLEKDIREKVSNDQYLGGENSGLQMNLINHVVTVNDKNIHLTPKEFEILRLLLENKGHYLSRAEIIEKVWDDSTDKEVRIVDTHIKKIREKTGCFQITTVRGYGYMWRD